MGQVGSCLQVNSCSSWPPPLGAPRARNAFVCRAPLAVGVLCSPCACRTLVVVPDIGLDADGAIEHLRRQLAIVEIIDKLDGQLSPDPYRLAEAGSELAALAETAPDAPINLLLSVRAGLTAARGALDQIASLLGHDLPTDAIVLQTLLRTALLGAGRVVFALAPADLGQRQRNVRVVLRQEGHSLMRGLNSFAEFEHLASLKPQGAYLEEQRRLNKALQGGAQPAGEATTLKEVARVIGEQLATSGFDESAAPDVLAEHIMWIWHAYSGAAHGLAWPWLLPGTDSMAGDFVADLGVVVPVTHLAFDVTQRRCRVT